MGVRPAHCNRTKHERENRVSTSTEMLDRVKTFVKKTLVDEFNQGEFSH